MCAKNQNDRYLTASGVQKDLQFCLDNFSKLSTLKFECGIEDLKQFQIPNKLYGREEELSLLKSIVISKETNMCLVSGYSGCGKSKLIEELSNGQQQQMMMGVGKYDQFDRTLPYSGFISICKSLMVQLTEFEDEEEKKRISDSLKEKLGDEYGPVMNSIIPEIKLFIGEQKEVIQLDRSDDIQNRLFQAFMIFFNSFSDQKSLILVIDDLQWADSASFKLLEELLKLNQKSHLFLIGAYRDNEVDSTHPLIHIKSKFTNIEQSI